MGLKGSQTERREADPELIAELISAVQRFVLHRIRPEDGILIEARQLAGRWKLAGQSVFGSSTQDLTLLLAGLIVAMRRDHEVFALIRQHRPEELDKLIRESSDAEIQTLTSEPPSTQPTLTAKQRYEIKRGKRNRAFTRSIEHQFGGGLEAQVDWQTRLLPLLGPTAYKDKLRRSQTCLDHVFAGGSVNTLRLEELFWLDRHRFAEALRGFHKRQFNYVAVTKIMDFLLKEQRLTKRKKSGRPRRKPWLDDPQVRRRVLMGIEARINSLDIDSKIANAFLTVIRRHVKSGKKKR
jgi:hypothetical protein